MKPEFLSQESILDQIRRKDLFIHVPYHSFDGYIRVLREAALKPEVKSIKTTLYRLAKDSKVVKALICAARNGKKVTAVVELLARFDEESNIKWSKRMQEEGINVIFGVEGLKIHSKALVHRVEAGQHRLHRHWQLPRGQRQDLHRLPDDDRTQEHRAGGEKKCSTSSTAPSPKCASREPDGVAQLDEEPRPLAHQQRDKERRAGREAWIKMKINHITEP